MNHEEPALRGHRKELVHLNSVQSGRDSTQNRSRLSVELSTVGAVPGFISTEVRTWPEGSSNQALGKPQTVLWTFNINRDSPLLRPVGPPSCALSLLRATPGCLPAGSIHPRPQLYLLGQTG